jgi:hypothetical protein
MERIKLDYEPLSAAVARCDQAHIEVEARKLRDRHIAHFAVRSAASVPSAVRAIGRGFLAQGKHSLRGSLKANGLLNYIRM